MCQVHSGSYVSLLAPGKTDYTVCHPRKTTTYILHVVSITTHTHDRRKSIGKKKHRKEEKINVEDRVVDTYRRSRTRMRERTRHRSGIHDSGFANGVTRHRRR